MNGDAARILPPERPSRAQQFRDFHKLDIELPKPPSFTQKFRDYRKLTIEIPCRQNRYFILNCEDKKLIENIQKEAAERDREQKNKSLIINNLTKT